MNNKKTEKIVVEKQLKLQNTEEYVEKNIKKEFDKNR